MPRLLIGPVLRHVGTTDATVFVETDEACEVEVLGSREHTWLAGGHHYALVTVEDLAPARTEPRSAGPRSPSVTEARCTRSTTWSRTRGPNRD